MEDLHWFARHKVSPFLYDLHAIRFPAQHPLEVRVAGSLLDGWVEAPGAALCSPRMSAVQKALFVKQDFRRIACAVKEIYPQDPVRGVTEFCVQNTVSLELEPLRDDHDNMVTVEQLLPDDEVVAAMVSAWGDHNAPRCQKLEMFIAAENSPHLSA